MTSRALVTGATGFIGSNLALHLESLGMTVVALDAQTKTSDNLSGFKGEVIACDMTRPLDLAGHFDLIFHQASLTDPRYENDREMFDSNSRGFENAVKFAEAKGARLIYASTAGLYGNGPTPMQENQPKQVLTAYAQSKLDMDHKVPELSKRLPIVGLRYFNVFGPREAHKGRPASMIYHLAKEMRAGKSPRIFSAGEQRRDHVYVKDAVEANVCALSAPSGVYNVGTGVGTSFNELVEILNRVLDTTLPPEYFPMPYDPATYQSHTQADTRLSKTELGFSPRWALEAAIRDYLRLAKLAPALPKIGLELLGSYVIVVASHLVEAVNGYHVEIIKL